MAKKDENTEISLAVLGKLNTREEYQIILDSGAIPGNLDTPEKLMTVILTGKELGMAQMTAINNIHVIKGRTVISSAMLGALLKSRNIEYRYTKNYVTEGDRIITEIEFTYVSKVTGKPTTANFDISWGEMELAGYTGKPNWEKYPKNMMRARCMAYAVRALFPEVLLGVYTDAEIVDAMDTGHDMGINEEGDVVVVDTGYTEVEDED